MLPPMLMMTVCMCQGKKLLMIVLKTFERWFTASTADMQSYLDYSIQLQAFAVIIRDSVPFPHGVDIIVKCFRLDSLNYVEDCVVLVRQLLSRKDFAKVCCIESTYGFYNSDV